MLVFFQFGFQTDWFTMSQLPEYQTPLQLQSLKRKKPPLTLLPPLARNVLLTPGQLTSEILDEQGTEPPTRQMSQLQIQDIAPPNPLPCRRPPGCWAQSTQLASTPTWGQIKSLCHQAQKKVSLQGSSVSPEKVFIAMLALLSCQVSTSPIPTKYWVFLPGPPTFQVVTWNSDSI